MEFNLAWAFQSRLKISILTFRIPHTQKKQGLVGGSPENVQSCLRISIPEGDLDNQIFFSNLWALRIKSGRDRKSKAWRKILPFPGLLRRLGATKCMRVVKTNVIDDAPSGLRSSQKLFRVAQEPNRNREPEPSEPFFPKPKAEPEPPEPFSRNRNRNRNRPFLLNCAQNKEKLVLQRNRRNRKPEPLEPFHRRTVTEPNRGLPDYCEINSENTILCNWNEIFQENNSQHIFPCNSLNHKRIRDMYFSGY